MDHGPISGDRRLDEPVERTRLAPVIGAIQRRPIVMVLGMHRSGTSLCSHILSALGVEMTDALWAPGTHGPADDNPRGHWERWDIVALHDRILNRLNRGYYTPFHDFALPSAWWADPDIVQIRHEITNTAEARITSSPFGVKDPRLMRLMPIWHQVSTDLNLAPKIILCLRNPAEVARSLNTRDRLDREIGEYRWLVHMVDFFRYSGQSEFCVVEYEKWFENPRRNYDKIVGFLDLETHQSAASINATLADLVDPDLRHDGNHLIEARHPLVHSLYNVAARADHDQAARDEAQSIASQFIMFEQLQRPFVRSYETLAAELEQTHSLVDTIKHSLAETARERDARGEVVETQHAEIAALRSMLDDREASVRSAQAQSALTEQRLNETLAKIDREREAHSAALQTRETALQAREQEISALRSTLEERKAQLQAAAADLQAAEADKALAERRMSESQADNARERDERAAAYATVLAELSALRSTLDQREAQAALTEARLQETDDAFQHERGQHAAASEAFAAQISTLRSTLEERDAQIRAAQEEKTLTQARLTESEAAVRREQEERSRVQQILQTDVSALRSILDARNAQIRSTQAHQALLETHLAETQAAIQRERDERSAARETLEAEISALRSTLDEREAGICSAEAQKARAERLLSQAQAEIQQERNASAAAVETLQAELSMLRSELAERQAQIRSAEARQAMAEKRISDKETEIQRERDQRQSTASALQAEISTLRATVEEFQAALREAEAQKARIEMQLSETQIEIQRERSERSATLETRLAEIYRLRVKLRDRETELAESGKLASNAERQLLEAHAASREQDIRIRDLEQQCELHQANLEILRRQAEERLAGLQAERTECVSQLEAVRQELRSRDARIAAVQHANLALSGELAAARHVGKAMLSTIRFAAASQQLSVQSIAAD